SIAARLFCVESRGPIPCGNCVACKKVASGIHPDLRRLETEGKEIKIESVREVQKWLFIAPHEAKFKIVVIATAELLNIAASNALLKTLEEPPPFAYLILTARSSENLLPTIRSRLTMIRFPAGAATAESPDEIPEWRAPLDRLLREGSMAPGEIFELT